MWKSYLKKFWCNIYDCKSTAAELLCQFSCRWYMLARYSKNASLISWLCFLMMLLSHGGASNTFSIAFKYHSCSDLAIVLICDFIKSVHHHISLALLYLLHCRRKCSVSIPSLHSHNWAKRRVIDDCLPSCNSLVRIQHRRLVLDHMCSDLCCLRSIYVVKNSLQSLQKFTSNHWLKSNSVQKSHLRIFYMDILSFLASNFIANYSYMSWNFGQINKYCHFTELIAPLDVILFQFFCTLNWHNHTNMPIIYTLCWCDCSSSVCNKLEYISFSRIGSFRDR